MLQVQNAIPFNRAPVVGRELELIREALEARRLAGDGPHTRWCQDRLKEALGAHQVLLTTSCTTALELAGLLCGLAPGDEVIMPSFTFVSTANAVVLRGARPVFVDVRPDTLNIDETLIEAAVTPRTRAIFPVHYAAVCAEMDAINAIATRHGLAVVEDAAQAIGASYKGRPAGTLGDMGCFSFHETKNVVSGEGGALALRDATHADRARILWEKGTNRTAFLLGQVDKYTWVDVGSSFLPSEITAAVLRAQLESAREIIDDRLRSWGFYHAALEDAEGAGLLRRPIVPDHCVHNAHIYYVLCGDRAQRDGLIGKFRSHGITASFHYIPLHSAPAGQRFGRTQGELTVTDDIAGRLLRLPLWYGMGEKAGRVVEILRRELGLPSL
ncbi:MAG: dTDP-4-amino-4,6-dideoxygalactose transaminase [Bradyrhizobiaceae bacterium]|nr:MAG: dTDP-4-amino-4,6-dideoxygalactose transaminase [Bradyrhizobiaceae bacterium]